MSSLQVMILNSTQFSTLYNDHGSGALYDVQTWRPQPPTGFFSLDDHAESASGYSIYGSSPLGAVVAAKDITESQTALAAPTGFQQVWTDKGSGAYQDGSIWLPVPPPGYVPLGCVVQVGYSTPSTDVMMCVREDLVTYAQTGPLVWSDKGSGADKDVTLWSSSQKPSVTPPAIDVGAFMANDSYDLYTGSFYLLDSNEVDWVTNEDAWGSTIQNLIGDLSVGYAYTVAIDGIIWSSGGYGYARAPWELDSPSVPMTATTPIHLASISKLITALALASLIENNLEPMLNTPFWLHRQLQDSQLGRKCGHHHAR